MLHVDLRHRAGDFALEARFAVPGGLTVLFGPSGAGKTLTLQLLAGLARPLAGHARFNGTVFVDTAAGVWLSPRDRLVGMVFQDALLLPHRSALGNVGLAVRHGGRHERRDTARTWLERVDATDLANRRPGSLSGGQRQRVALARALAGRPRLLLLDEPFSALELPVRRRLRALVRRLVDDEQVPTVFVTHDPDEAAELADRVVFAQPGWVGRVEPRDRALRLLSDT
jgi:molybdate transport system ATP-binding protein